MHDKKAELYTATGGCALSCKADIVCGPIYAAGNSNGLCEAKSGCVRGCRAAVEAGCPALAGVTSRFAKKVDAGPMRDLGDLYGRCYKRWGMFTSDVNALLGVANTSDIEDPQEAWQDILRFRSQEMLE